MIWNRDQHRSSERVPNEHRQAPIPAVEAGGGKAGSGHVRIVDIVAEDPPSFAALRDDQRFVIMLDGSAVMKLCGMDSYTHLSRHLASQLGRVAAAAECVLKSRRQRQLPSHLIVSALDFDLD